MSDFLEGLSRKEKAILERVLGAGLEQKKGSSEARLIREIVPIDKWLDSEYYLGPDAVRVYDFWKSEIVDIYNKPNKYNEIIIDGAIGCGKSTAAEIIMLRKLYELSCYTNVQALFGLMSKKPVVFFYFSVSKTQAELTGFGDIRSFIDSSPYFNEEFPRNGDINSILMWPKEKLLFLYGSSPMHSIGMDMIGSIMDEANFFQGESDQSTVRQQEYSKAARLYANSRQRARSRFLTNQIDHSLSILVSSSTHQTSFTEDRKSKAVNDDKCKVITARLWDVKPKDSYSPNKFYVFCGSSLIDPMIVTSVADINAVLEAADYPPLPVEMEIPVAISKLPADLASLFEAVSESFKRDFEGDLISALQNIAGRSVAPMGKLFTARPVMMQAFKAGKEQGAEHPFTKESICVPHMDTAKVEDFLRKGFRFKNPQRKRYVHIDQSTTNDCTGISCCYVHHVDWVEGVPKPTVMVDFMLRIEPPKPPKKISIAKVRDFLFYLRDHCHLTFGKVTYDWFACLTKDTQVITSDGVKQLIDVKVGDRVNTILGYRRVTKTHQFYDAPTIRVHFSNGVILEGTANHKIWYLRGWENTPCWGWKEFRDLTIDDVVYSCSERDNAVGVHVVKIEHSRNDVCDITVEGENAYFANEFYVHNSAESLQVLEEQGVDCAHLSVDRTDEQYLTTVNMFFEHRLWLYQYNPFEEEFLDLIHFRNRRKVDHPVEGSKDVADSLVGAVYNALSDDLEDLTPVESMGVFSEVNTEIDLEEELFPLAQLLR